ncbi:hypothetical protein [Saccharibacillus qingshengii]|uniref:hypothetical protein n=1 Tax=Saccharibacillus qingshengii TaxID=1763540 RepID=UPI0015552BC6|nr:hypothetical protein [Saccharibacillus qingshengii]
MSLIYLIGLTLLGLLLMLFLPQYIGIYLVLAVIFAFSILNARRTRELHAGMEEIRRHLGLMGKAEAENYDLEREIDGANRLSDEEREAMDRRTEAQLKRETDS